MNIYYVYAYVRASDGTPYYIGKGKGRRMYAKHRHISVPKDKTKIIILESNLTEVGAFALERRLIRWWGRKDLNTGVLLNKTDGGDGRCNIVVSNETREKMSNAHKGKTRQPFSNEHRAKISLARKGNSYGPLSDETRAKISESLSGKKYGPLSSHHRNNISLALKGISHGPRSDETRRKISDAQRGRIHEHRTCPHCGKVGKWTAMTRYHFDNCKVLTALVVEDRSQADRSSEDVGCLLQYHIGYRASQKFCSNTLHQQEGRTHFVSGSST